MIKKEKWKEKVYCNCGRWDKTAYVNHVNGRYCCKQCYQKGIDDLQSIDGGCIVSKNMIPK